MLLQTNSIGKLPRYVYILNQKNIGSTSVLRWFISIKLKSKNIARSLSKPNIQTEPKHIESRESGVTLTP